MVEVEWRSSERAKEWAERPENHGRVLQSCDWYRYQYRHVDGGWQDDGGHWCQTLPKDTRWRPLDGHWGDEDPWDLYEEGSLMWAIELAKAHPSRPIIKHRAGLAYWDFDQLRWQYEDRLVSIESDVLTGWERVAEREYFELHEALRRYKDGKRLQCEDCPFPYEAGAHIELGPRMVLDAQRINSKRWYEVTDG